MSKVTRIEEGHMNRQAPENDLEPRRFKVFTDKNLDKIEHLSQLDEQSLRDEGGVQCAALPGQRVHDQ